MTLSDPRLIAEAAESIISFTVFMSAATHNVQNASKMLQIWLLQCLNSKKRIFSFKERCLRQILKQYCVVAHKIPDRVIMSCWRKSYYNHAEQVSSPSLGKVQDSSAENVQQNIITPGIQMVIRHDFVSSLHIPYWEKGKWRPHENSETREVCREVNTYTHKQTV